MKNQIILGQSEDGIISLDIEKLLESRMIVQGNSGSGKSGVIRLICERLPKQIPFILIDLEGEFASLRERVDLVLVAPNGDIPTDIRSAALLARKLVELRVSAVIDLFEFPGTSGHTVLHRRREYVKAFAEATVNLPKSLWQPTIYMLPELQQVCPERGSNQKDVMSTQAVIDMITLGRKRNFSFVGDSQRFSKVHNDALAELKNVFIGGTWLDADQKKAGDYLGFDLKERRSLRDLEPQEFYCFGPALSLKGVRKFRTDKCETSFPKPGQKSWIDPPKASDVITQIVSQIDNLPAEAEQEKKDIDSLRAENRELKRQLTDRPTVPEPVTEYVDKEVPVMTAEVITAAESLGDSLSNKIVDLIHDLEQNIGEFQGVADQIRDAVVTVTGKAPQAVSQPQKAMAVAAGSSRKLDAPQSIAAKTLRPAPKPQESLKRAPIDHNGDLSSLQRLILGGTALLHRLGEENPTVAQVGAIIGKSHKAGPVRGAFNFLHDAGYAQIAGVNITLTEAGETEAEVPDIQSRADIHEMWLNRLSGNEREFLRLLISQYPQSVTKERLGEAIGKNHTAGPIRGSFNALVEKGLAVSDGDELTASSLLFPEGLA
jgi:hypothetical protein